MRLAVFDIDGTLVTGPATEKRFGWHLARLGRIGPMQALAFVSVLPRGFTLYGAHVLKKNKAYLAGLHEDELSALAAEWAPKALASAWFEPCLARLERHRQAGDEVVLLSGTPQFVCSAIASALGVSHAIGSRCATRDGRFLASAPLSHPFGAEKIAMVRELIRRRGATLDDVTAYADSIHDLPLFLAVGTPVAVRPDESLAAVARERDWEMLGEVRRGVVRSLTRAVAAALPTARRDMPGRG